MLLTLPALMTTSAAAENDTGAAADRNRRYTVEMIIFSYAQDVGTGSEVFTPVFPPADALNTDMANAEAAIRREQELPLATRMRPYEIVRLASSDFSMDEIYDHIRRLDVYRPLMHFGWTQETRPENETGARPLASFSRPPNGLDGDLTLYLGRYLHLVVDLKLDARGLDASGSAPIRYHIDENRIIRNGEIRYFDHPKFGLLAKVLRVDAKDDDPLDEPELFSSD